MLHNTVFGAVQVALENWALGLLARLWFAAALVSFFWSSALTKVGPGGVDTASFAAQALGPGFFDEPYFGDATQLGPEFTLMAYAGTLAEFVLPALIIVGLFTRLAALGMIAFIAVMTYFDVTAHGVTTDVALLLNGAPENAVVTATTSAAIYEYRLAWLFPLLYLVIRGAGWISVDALGRR